MESTRFQVILDDGLSAPASRMDAALEKVERGLRDVEAPLKRLERTFDTVGSKIDAVDRRLETMTKLMAQGSAASNQLAEAQLRSLAQMEINARRTHTEMVQVIRDLGSATSAAQKLKSVTAPGGRSGSDREALFAGLIGGGFGGAFGALGGFLGGPIGAAFGTAMSGGVGSAFGGGLALAQQGIDSSDEKRRNMLGLEMMLGGREQAQGAFDYINRVADLTPLENRDVMSYFQQLNSAGFKDNDQITTILAGISDVAAMKGGDAANSVMRQLLQVNAKGHLMTQDLNAMAEAAPGLISAESIKTIVARRRGISPEAAAGLIEGKLGRIEATAAILESISMGLGGQKLGEFSLKQATGSFEGLASTLKSKFRRLFEDVDTSPLLGFMDKLQQVLDPSSETGARAQKSVQNIFDALMTPFERYTTPDGMKRLTEDVTTILNVVDKLAEKFRYFAKGFDIVTGNATDADRGRIASKLEDLLPFLPKGYARENLHEILPFIDQEKPKKADSADGWYVKSEETIAPKEFATGGIVMGPRLGLVGEAGPELILPLSEAPRILSSVGAAGAAGAQVHVTINANGADSASAGESIANQVRDILPSALASAFEQLALQAGHA